MKLLKTKATIPYNGFMAKYAMQDVMHEIEAARTSIIFVNTRAQAELVFQLLWDINETALPLGIYHSSLTKEKRLKTITMMAEGKLRAFGRHLGTGAWYRLGGCGCGNSGRRAERRQPFAATHWPSRTIMSASQARPGWCPPTASRYSNAAQQSTPSSNKNLTVNCRGRGWRTSSSNSS